MMRRVFQVFILLFAFCICVLKSFSQFYFRGEQMAIKPTQVLIENYVQIKLKPVPDMQSNVFDKQNAYTYLQLIHEDFGKASHLLYQTDFFGKILYLAYSSNLSAIFNNVDKPMNTFVSCMQRLNDHISPVQNVELAVRCVIERLNYCSSK